MNSPATPRFGAFCFASFLLSIAYGATFLLSLLVRSFGGNEHDAGQVFAVAMVSTLIAVLVSGHVLQRLGAARCIALGALCLVLASLGFATASGLGLMLMWLAFVPYLLGAGYFFVLLVALLLADHPPWLLVAVAFRYSSLASLVAAILAPVLYLLLDGVVWYAEQSITVAIAAMALLLVWRHRENVLRLLAGKESKLGKSKK